MSTRIPGASGPPNGTEFPSDFAELVSRFRTGSQEAARRLYDKYSRHVLRVIRRNFMPADSPLRRDIDSIDVLQEAWGTVFELLQQGKTFATEEKFIGFILAVVGDHFREFYRARVTSQKRALNREEAFDSKRHDKPEVGSDPSEHLAAEDKLRHWWDALPERQGFIVQAIHAGEPYREFR